MTPTATLPRRVLGSAAALALSVGGAVGVLAIAAGPASAATIVVTNTADDGSNTSLRGVLENATDGDVVVLTAGATYQLTICSPPAPASQEGSPGWGDVEIDGAVTIQGNGATIEQTCPDRVLYTQSGVTLQDVTVTGGNVNGPGGGLFQDSANPVTLDGATFAGNTATGGGGGVATYGDVSITGSTFTDNHETNGNDGGGVRVFAAVGTTTITDSVFTGNTTTGWGGAWEQQGTEGGSAAGGYVLQVSGSTFTGNSASGDGGGALDTEDDATIAIDHSTLSGNTGGWGGAVGTFGSTTTFTSDSNTFSGNTSGEDGGAVHLSGGDTGTTASFVNSTITGNTEGAFGAIGVEGDVNLNQVTLTDNTSLGQPIQNAAAASGRGGNVGALAVEGDAANVAAYTFTSRNSVITQPHGAVNCTSFDSPATDGGYNFSDDASCGLTAATSNVKTPNDPMLGALADNGGPTQTLLPLAGSPLIDAIPPASCGSNVDQRGVTRPQGPGCDIGAVEVEFVAPPAPSPAVVVTPKFTG